MKQKIISFFIICSFLFPDVIPFSKKNFDFVDGDTLTRGSFLIVLASPDLYVSDMVDFIHLKKTQGFHVDVISFREASSEIYGLEGEDADDLRDYLIDYYIDSQDISVLEYVLLVGDVNQNSENMNIPTYTIPSYNEPENDQTDYPYTFFDSGSGEDILEPNFFIGRWSVGSNTDLKNIIQRNIRYAELDYDYYDPDYLNNALVVAGNYSGEGTEPQNWPVTPVWTSKWLQEELFYFGYDEVDSSFFHKYNHEYANADQISESWNNGIGIINYRGWGDARGWHKPQFRLDEIESDLNPTLNMPVVFSFVCNTGDFGNESNVFCFGEKLITAGTLGAPKGAVAMVGPSDLDTDTRFNNVLCGGMWDVMLEGRGFELGSTLHSGKQAIVQEFGDLEVNGTNIGHFYHHVYGVIGDPSLSVWIGEPGEMSLNIQDGHSIDNSFLNIIVEDDNTGNPLGDVIGVVMLNEEILGKAISNQNGELDIDFGLDSDSAELDLYLNKGGEYYPRHYSIVYNGDSDDTFYSNSYDILEEPDYGYTFNIIDYNWVDISSTGENLSLVDDSTTTIDLGFEFGFQYYEESYNEITVCSNGWTSFYPCLNGNDDDENCDQLSYFYNHSINFPIGPYGMLAPFYDDLDDNEGTEELNVYAQFIEDESRFIIQWDNIANSETDEFCINNGNAPDPEECKKETFQLILENSALGDVNRDSVYDILDIISIVQAILESDMSYQYVQIVGDWNADGDVDIFDIIFGLNQILGGVQPQANSSGRIIFQYKEIYNIDDHGATIGIEAPSKNEGVQYLFNQNYHEDAIELQNSLGIIFYKL